MDLKIIGKNLNKANIKILKETLNKINPNIGRKLISWVLQHPRYLKSFFPLYRAYTNAQQIREKELGNGLQVPPTLIISITPSCNLNCKGCYSSTAGNIKRHKSSETKTQAKTLLNREQWRKIIKEAGELGIFVNIIAGGEPFLFPELIELCGEFKDQTFVIFTNGTALTQVDYNLLKHSTNLAIIVSIHSLLLKPEERREFRAQVLKFRSTKPIFIIHSPGDEEYFGGCVSAGRGFTHVTPAGDLTPCPVSNIATHNLTNSTLREGLASPLFKEICKNEHLLETEGMPCALFAHPEEVSALAKLVGAYRTDLNI